MEAESRKTDSLKLLGIIAIGSTVITKILGLLREMLISGALGATAESDAYNISYLLIITIFGLYSSAYSNALVPTTAKLYSKDKEELNKIVSAIITISLVFVLVLVAAMHMFPRFFVLFLASGANEQTIAIAEKLIKISSWSLAALTVGSALDIILRIFDRNIAPSLAAMLFPVPILLMLVCGCKSVHVLIWGVVIGYFAQMTTMLLWTKKTTFRYKFHFHWKNQYITDFFLMMPPMLLSAGLLQINTLVDNQIASGFGVGSVTALQQASKVNSLAYNVFSTALIQIVYTKLTKAHTTGDIKQYQEMVKQQVKLILTFIVPCAIIVPLYSKEIICMLFLRGNYTIEAAEVAGILLRGYSVGLIFFVLRDIVTYIYYSVQNSKFPSFVNGVAAIANVVLNILLSHILGIKGIAYATALSVFLSFFILYIFMKRKAISVQLIEKKDCVKVCLAAIVCFAALLFAKQISADWNVWSNVFIFAGGFIVYWGVLFFCLKW